MIVGGAILPFSSVLVPEVGRGRERPAFATIAAMRRAVRALAALQAELLLLAVPAAEAPADLPLHAYAGGRLRARFDDFGEHETEIVTTGAPDVAAALAAAGLVVPVPSSELPAEAATILYFLQPACQLGAPLLVLATPRANGAAPRTALHDLGGRLAALPALASRRVAVVVGAELSQRIFPGAPEGYHPDGVRFDEAVQQALAASNLDALDGAPAALAAAAGERAMAGLSLLRGLVAGAARRFRLLSYEAPFGAGLAVATLTTEPAR